MSVCDSNQHVTHVCKRLGRIMYPAIADVGQSLLQLLAPAITCYVRTHLERVKAQPMYVVLGLQRIDGRVFNAQPRIAAPAAAPAPATACGGLQFLWQRRGCTDALALAPAHLLQQPDACMRDASYIACTG